MSHQIRRAEYYHATVPDRPGEALKVLSGLADQGVHLVAFTTMPVGPAHTQVTLFPDDAGRLGAEAARIGLSLDGPNPALVVQGDDELGALVSVHERLASASVNVYASTGVTDGRGRFGYVIYIKPQDLDTAAGALGI